MKIDVDNLGYVVNIERSQVGLRCEYHVAADSWCPRSEYEAVAVREWSLSEQVRVCLCGWWLMYAVVDMRTLLSYAYMGVMVCSGAESR